MRGHKKLWILVLLSSTLAVPSLASAQGGYPMPDLSGIQLPDLSGLQMPTIQQGPGGYTVTFPGYPSVTIPDVSGLILGAPTPTGPETPWQYPTQPEAQPQPSWPVPVPSVPGWTMPTQPSWPTPAPTLPTWPTYPPNTNTQPAPAPAPGPAAPGSTGRVVGVFGGITDYPSGNDLPNCADDARNLANAFIQAGIIAPSDAIVLTDGQATRRNFYNAVQQLAGRIGQDDTLVFFFSGHGDRQPDNNGDEADGMDESIVLYDGSLVDDELVNLLSGARGRDLLALDTCYAGGFQQDLARLSQSVGFYSSTETQTSQVASEFGAGGYLSHFMRTGVEQSRGRQLQVGQLQQHIQQGFMSSGAAGQQDLVVGTGPGASQATVIFDGSRTAPSYLASR